MRDLRRGPAHSSRVVAAEARAGLARKEHVPACAVLRRRVAWRVTMPRHSLAHDWLSCVRIDPGGALMPVAPWRLCRHAQRRQQVLRLAHLDPERILNPDERAHDLLDGRRIVPATGIELREMVQYGEGEPQWQDGGEDTHP